MRFYDQVYQMVRQIPKGRVASYGQIALLCGSILHAAVREQHCIIPVDLLHSVKNRFHL